MHTKHLISSLLATLLIAGCANFGNDSSKNPPAANSAATKADGMGTTNLAGFTDLFIDP